MQLFHQHSSKHLPRTLLPTIVNECRQGYPFIQDVIKHNDVAIPKRDRRFRLPCQFTAGGCIGITGSVDIIQFQRKVQTGQQMASRHHGTGHHAQKDWIGIFMAGGNLGGHAIQLLLNLCLGIETIGFGQYLSDFVWLHHTLCPAVVPLPIIPASCNGSGTCRVEVG